MKALTARSMVATILVACCPAAYAQTVVPTDSSSTCKVSPVELADWFASGMVAANGIVDPADSVTFPNIPNCSFYKWSEQMFLWLTSPAPSKYGQGTHVFNSPVFYNVSPPDALGQRTLSPNSPGRLILNPRISQLGPAKKPVVFDKTGRMFTVVRPELSAGNKLLVRNKLGDPIEVKSTQIVNGKPLFIDHSGKAIDAQLLKNGAPRLLDQNGKAIDIRLDRKILINGKTFFFDAFGNLVETEQGQADGNVLMANGNKLVYYALQVNDVYAYFMTGTKNGGITPAPTQFPITATDLNKIKAFGLAHSKTFPDAVALAVELKSSWVEATGLDPAKYITMSATIPTYDTSNPQQWVQTGTKTATLAMVGMHIVGSAAGHPELIWATFEHVDNTRNAAYSYNSTTGPKNVMQNNGGTWLFSTTPPSANPNNPTIQVANNGIAATTPAGVVPTDILRENAWGTAPASGAFAANNSDIIAINDSVINQLIAPDVRRNYVMTGTTWTPFGSPPGPGNLGVGTNKMANSTMETFFQFGNCFSCHSGDMLGTPGSGGLSHVWGDLKPLFP
jgi:hypothetical protein